MSQTLTSTNATAHTSESNKQEEQKIKTLWDSIEENSEIYDLLYPPLPDNYFDDVDLNQLAEIEPKNPIDKMVKKYADAKIKPYVRRTDLNDGNDDAPPKNVWEIGVKIDF